MNQIGPGIVTVISGIIGLAIIAVIMSKNAQTPSVISTSGSALAQVIGAAVSPVTGSSSNTFGSSSTSATGGMFSLPGPMGALTL